MCMYVCVCERERERERERKKEREKEADRQAETDTDRQTDIILPQLNNALKQHFFVLLLVVGSCQFYERLQ